MNASSKPRSHVPPSPESSVRRASGIRPSATVRRHAALVRALLDELERTAPAELEDSLSAQAVEELGRLGCRCVELAVTLARLIDEQERARGGRSA